MIGTDAFVGKPWKLGATGPEAFDCWGLTVEALRALFDCQVPPLAAHLCIARVEETPAIAAAALASGHWREVWPAEPGAVAAFYDAGDALRHVGLCLGAGQLLHTRRGAGARLEPLGLISLGWAAARFYRWAP